MSGQQVDKILLYFYRAAVGVMLTILGWFVLELYQSQKTLAAETAERVHSIELWRAETAGNRFTAADWTKAKEIIDQQIVALDKRTTRNEDAVVEIRETQKRIERKIDELIVLLQAKR